LWGFLFFFFWGGGGGGGGVGGGTDVSGQGTRGKAEIWKGSKTKQKVES
jgi:hypothetical protein